MIHTHKLLVRAVLVCSIMIILLSSLILLKLGLIDLAKNGFIYMGIPVIISGMLLINKPKMFNKTADNMRMKSSSILANFNYLALAYILLYVISICLLVSDERGFIYFVLIAFIALLILCEILSISIENSSLIYIILSQIILVLLNISLGYTLKKEMVIFTTDIFFHINYVLRIIESGQLGDFMFDYKFFPLFHVWNSIGILLIDIDPKIAYHIINTFIFSFSIIFIYLIAKCLVKDVKISLLAALLYIFIRPITLESMDFLTRTGANIFAIIIFYLIIRQSNFKISGIAVFLILPLTLLHQITLLHFTFIILIFYISAIIIHDKIETGILYPLLFICSYTSYWLFICGPAFSKWISKISEISEPVFVDKEIVARSALAIFLDNIDYSLIIFLTFIGAIMLLYKFEDDYDIKHRIALGTLVLLPLYIPNTANLMRALLGYRFPLEVAHFVAIVAAVGFSRIFANFKNKFLNLILLISIIYFLLSSCLIGVSTDFNGMSYIFGNESSNFLTASELNSFDFCHDFTHNSTTIYTDYASRRYLDTLRSSSKNSHDIIGTNYANAKPNSFFLFRQDEYATRGILYFKLDSLKRSGFYEEIRKAVRIENLPYVDHSWLNGSKIYGNKNVCIYWKPA